MHIPVLLNEVMDFVGAQQGRTFIDGTVGEGGYLLEILKINKKARILGIDLDQTFLGNLKLKLEADGTSNRVTLVNGNFADIKTIAYKQGFEKVSGIILDLGFSSAQIDDPQRGFSFQSEGPLDMRYSLENPLTAAEVVNTYKKEKLEQIIKEYGEEKFYRRIASKIVDTRVNQPVITTKQLVSAVIKAIPNDLWKKNDVIRRVFQAIRIEVNQELDNLKKALPEIVDLLETQGRMVVISFHSLEDRIVKNFLRKAAYGCVCPPEFPVCVCGKSLSVKILTRKPVTAAEEELVRNPRSKSAKLRAAEKVM